MEDEHNKYIIGFCKYCNSCKAIKNGLCSDCEKKLKNLTGNEKLDKLFGDFYDS